MADHITKIKVRGYQLDLYGHVNNARYLEFLEEARWAFFEEKVDFDAFATKGLAFVIANININFRFPAVLGDLVRIETGVKSIGTRSVTMRQELFIDVTGKAVADADVTFVILDVKSGKATHIDSEAMELMGISAS